MNFAIVPSSDEQYNDKYFKDDILDDSAPCYFAQGLRRSIQARGDEIHTIDMYEDWSDIDYVFVDWPIWLWTFRLYKKGLLTKTIYCNAEPTSVIPENCPEGYKRLKKIYPYILTWNRDWIDNESIFKKNIPYPFLIDFGQTEEKTSLGVNVELSEEEFKRRKLITGITADKKSDVEGELYSERRRIYSYFEKNHSDNFDLYGVNWNGNEHSCYRGTVESKLDTYHNYRFAICLENTRGVKDYVTEKIFDCLCAGIVPIYGGASNIDEYVPKECYIDYFSFDSYEDMYSFISNMEIETYNAYRKAIWEFLNKSDHSEYSIERYVEYIYDVVNTKKDFKIDLKTGLLICYKGYLACTKSFLLSLKHFLFK